MPVAGPRASCASCMEVISGAMAFSSCRCFKMAKLVRLRPLDVERERCVCLECSTAHSIFDSSLGACVCECHESRGMPFLVGVSFSQTLTEKQNTL